MPVRISRENILSPYPPHPALSPALAEPASRRQALGERGK